MEGQLADLVQEDGATVCVLKKSLACLHGMRKCPLFITKQFRFDQVVRDGTTVYGDQVFIRNLAEFVDGPGHQFLPHSCFAGNEHRRIKSGRTDDVFIHNLHGLGSANHTDCLDSQAFIALFQVYLALLGHDLGQDMFRMNGFFDKICSSALQSPDCIRNMPLPRNHDHCSFRMFFMSIIQRFIPVTQGREA